MKHKSKSEHVNKLMHGHHNNSQSPADILMRGHGSHHADGGPATKISTPLKRGGKACHGGSYATGGHVENERTEHHRRGGRAHSRREHHGWGEVAGKLLPHVIGGIHSLMQKADGGRINREPTKLAMCSAGSTHRRRRHAEGGPTDLSGSMSMNQPQQQQLMGANPNTYSPTPLKRGGRAHSKREHHGWGDVVGKLLPHVIGGISSLMQKADGGRINREPTKLAMGGAAKVRKGMMTEKGDMR